MDFSFSQFELPDDLVHADHFKMVFQGPLEHECFDHGIAVIVAAVNLAWAWFTFGFRLLLHTLDHLNDSVKKLMDGDVLGATLGGVFDYCHHTTNEAIALFRQTFDLGHVALFGHGYEHHDH